MTLRWGILGAAGIAREEVGPALSDDPRSTIHAVASRSKAAALSLATELGAERAYAAYEELLADPAIDAVYVPLPNAMHHDWVMRALGAGKHVLCEKPLGLSVREVSEMSSAAMSTGRHVAEGLMWRFHPRVAFVDGLLDRDAIGEVIEIRARYTADMLGRLRDSGDIRLDPHLGGGALNDLGSYCIDALHHFGRARASVVRARQRRDRSGVDIATDGVVEFENGVVGSFHAAMDTAGGGEVELIGTRGRIAVESAFRLRADRAPARVVVVADGEEHVHPVEPLNQYALEVAGFVATVLDGAHPVVPLSDSVATAAIAEAARQSSSRETSIRLA